MSPQYNKAAVAIICAALPFAVVGVGVIATSLQKQELDLRIWIFAAIACTTIFLRMENDGLKHEQKWREEKRLEEERRRKEQQKEETKTAGD